MTRPRNRLTTSLTMLVVAGLAACASEAPRPAATPMAGMAGMDHGAMMAHCAQMRAQPMTGMQMTPQMQQMMAQCTQMDRSMGQPAR